MSDSGVVFKYGNNYFLVNMKDKKEDSFGKSFYYAVDLSTRQPTYVDPDWILNKKFVKVEDPSVAADILMKAFGYNTGYTFGASKSYCCENGTCSESTTNSTCPKKIARRGSNAPSAQYIKEGTFCSPVETRFGGVNFPVCEKEINNLYPLGGKTRRRKGRKSRKGGRKSRK